MDELLNNISSEEIFNLLSRLQDGTLTERGFQNKIYYARKKKDLTRTINLLIAKELNKLYG